MKRAFSAEIEDDNIRIHDPLILKNFLKKIGEGMRVMIVVEKWYKKHSDKQRNYYFGVVVTELAKFTGFTLKEMHEALKAKFLIEPTKYISKVPSITSISTVQMEDFMQRVRVWAADSLDTYIPEPNEAPLEFKYKLPNEQPKTNGFIM